MSAPSSAPLSSAPSAAPAARSNGAAQLNGSRPAATVPRPPQSAAAPAKVQRTTPGILKSGVVDGMAYTLYEDGSIEAQLPEGVVRFGSIASLRDHLENTNS
jgi:hypothetical protein